MNALLKNTIGVFLLVLGITACATGAQQPGDTVGDGTGEETRQLHFICRIETGEVLETTDQKIAEDPTVKKSTAFVPRDEYGPIPVTLKEENTDPNQQKTELRFFGEVLMEKLSETTRGWKPGTEKTIRVTTEDQVDVPERERSIWLSRAKQVPKERRYDIERFEHMTTAEPEVGAVFYPFSEIKGTVASVDGNVVVATFAPVSEGPQQGSFGTSQVLDKENYYEIVTDVEIGRLVRMGPLVGRVAEVEREKFRVDYGHAFGGETLVCDVRVEGTFPDESEEDESDRMSVPITANVEESPNAREKVSDKEASTHHKDQKDQPDVSTQLEARLNRAMDAHIEAVGHGASESTPKSTQDNTETVMAATATGAEESIENAETPTAEEIPDVVQPGDLATVDFAAYLETGELVFTTWPFLAEDPGTKKVDWYKPSETYMPETITVGKKAESISGLANAIIGMRVGETKTVVVPPEMAFGMPDMKQMKEYNRKQSIPKTFEISVEDYKKQAGVPPREGYVVPYNPYVNGKVVKVDTTTATLALFPKMDKDESEIGTTDVTEFEDRIELFLTPNMGAPFQVGDHTGRIVSSEPDKFTVDFNHPLAGKEIVLDVDILSLTKASRLKALQITWVEDHDDGLNMAREENKPVVLVLYADWCPWCKRLLDETFTDVEVQRFKDQFVWIKINSEKETSLKALYEQTGFPLTVILTPQGDVVERLSGFQTPQGLAAKLEGTGHTAGFGFLN